MMAARNYEGSRSAVRTLQLLEYVADKTVGRVPVTLSSAARDLQLPLSTAHGFMAALLERGFVVRDASLGYRLGTRSFDIGAAFLSVITPASVIRPELVAVSRELNVIAHFAVLDGPDALFLDKEDPPGASIRVASAIGARLPAHITAVGKANLAQLADAKVTARVDISKVGESGRSLTLQDLLTELARTRHRGYAIDEGQTLRSVRCVAAPVFDSTGTCCGAIGVSYLRESGPSTRVVGSVLMSAAQRASDQLGGKRP